jgi:rubrerythrin
MGFAKHSLDILREKKFDSLEVADALRLVIIAELDAISLSLQLAKYIDDERVKKVFEDVAREEKAHFGEFFALLKTHDLGLEAELKAGAEEVREKTGFEAVRRGGCWIEDVAVAAREAVSSARSLGSTSLCIKPGRGRRRWPSVRPSCLLGS